MKVRTDFVTNSSSSSFVIAYRKIPDFDEDTLKKYPFLKTFPRLIEAILDEDSGYDTRSAERFTTKEEYDKYFIERYGWSQRDTIHAIIDDDDYLKDRYYKAIDYLKQGFAIAEKRVGYDDDGLINIIHTLANDNDSFVVLEDE